jgi:hypothetical protein
MWIGISVRFDRHNDTKIQRKFQEIFYLSVPPLVIAPHTVGPPRNIFAVIFTTYK